MQVTYAMVQCIYLFIYLFNTNAIFIVNACLKCSEGHTEVSKILMFQYLTMFLTTCGKTGCTVVRGRLSCSLMRKSSIYCTYKLWEKVILWSCGHLLGHVYLTKHTELARLQYDVSDDGNGWWWFGGVCVRSRMFILYIAVHFCTHQIQEQRIMSRVGEALPGLSGFFLSAFIVITASLLLNC